jgi:ABC-type antimicrobial peptide transport system permease subunit
MILRSAMLQALLGLAIGVPVALFGVRFVESQLYEITSADGNVMANALVMLVTAAFIAAFVPARRAASIDPL